MKSQPTLTRREFLRTTGMAAAGLTASSLAAGTASAASPRDRVLVVIQLSGGNDGLNTVVPFRDAAYYSARPVIAVQPRHVLTLGASDGQNRLGFHPSLRPLMSLWESGQMAVINGVGCPNADRSHFRALETWHTAMEAGSAEGCGWIGRCFDGNPPALGVSVGAEDPQALKGRGMAGIHLQEKTAAFQTESDAGDVAQAALEKSRVLLQRAGPSGATYPNTRFAAGLKRIAALIDGGLGARVYHHDITGFDTHANQPATHGRLWAEVSEGLRAFFADLEARGLAERVVAMSFSEFGRRVAENSSYGTDHGAASPMFIWGKPVHGGLYGEPPDLADLDCGDLKFTTDFRSVYATVLDGWLGANHLAVLGREYSKLRFVA
ncbi:MAG: DUF1501 domain-containing protein [Verrucomicrobia bacterium]|nr:DUF1501 domain-containing protein [Verrucomicrobiota bacterium]